MVCTAVRSAGYSELLCLHQYSTPLNMLSKLRQSINNIRLDSHGHVNYWIVWIFSAQLSLCNDYTVKTIQSKTSTKLRLLIIVHYLKVAAPRKRQHCPHEEEGVAKVTSWPVFPTHQHNAPTYSLAPGNMINKWPRWPQLPDSFHAVNTQIIVINPLGII